MAEWSFGYIPLYIIGALIGSYFIINASKYIKSKILQYYGRNTLIILGTHQAFLLPIRHYANMPYFSVWTGTAIFLGLLPIEALLIFVFNKFIPFLCGRKS